MVFLAFIIFSGLHLVTLASAHGEVTEAVSDLDTSATIGDDDVNIFDESPKFEGDIMGIPTDSQAGLLFNGVAEEKSKWPNGIVPYVISSGGQAGFATSHRNLIKQAMEEFHTSTCVRFRPRTKDDPTYIHIQRGVGCSSYPGRQNETGAQALSLGVPGCMESGIIQHELMHAIGFYHEQSREDRDEFVDIFWDNIAKGKKNQFQKYLSGNVFEQPYDFGSIMHYNETEFSSNGSPTIKPKKAFESNKIGQRNNLSPIDIKKINRMYKCLDHDETTEEPEIATPSPKTTRTRATSRVRRTTTAKLKGPVPCCSKLFPEDDGSRQPVDGVYSVPDDQSAPEYIQGRFVRVKRQSIFGPIVDNCDGTDPNQSEGYQKTCFEGSQGRCVVDTCICATHKCTRRECLGRC